MPNENESRPPIQIMRVKLRNFRSIAECDVELSPLTVLVGQNAAGKSNFLDAIQFIADAVRVGLRYAIQDHGGLDQLRHRRCRDDVVKIGIEYVWNERSNASFELALRDTKEGDFDVLSESLVIRGGSTGLYGYRIEDGSAKWIHQHSDDSLPVDLRHPLPEPPAPDNDLFLRLVSGLPTFAEHQDLLVGIERYRPSVANMQGGPESAATITLLESDGSNIATVLHGIDGIAPEIGERIRDYLFAIVPGLKTLDLKTSDRYIWLSFGFETSNGGIEPFTSEFLSDGTLRSLALLTASLQPIQDRDGRWSWLAQIEEPETAIHPGAAAVLMDAFHEASENRQILVTTHSPDLLERLEPTDKLLVVEWKDGSTHIAPPDYAGRESLRKRLYSAGELQRLGQLRPDRSSNGSGAHSHSPVVAQGPT
jgi:predicted ATPase